MFEVKSGDQYAFKMRDKPLNTLTQTSQIMILESVPQQQRKDSDLQMASRLLQSERVYTIMAKNMTIYTFFLCPSATVIV